MGMSSSKKAVDRGPRSSSDGGGRAGAGSAKGDSGGAAPPGGSSRDRGAGAGAPKGGISVLEDIRRAQDGKYTATVRGRTVRPSFEVSLSEIRGGEKINHWIWYVWPSLAAVRGGRVRKGYERFLLPDFKSSARAYLRDDVLRTRLVEITEAATAHLAAGVKPSTLFGVKSHVIDAEKFVETMVCFTAAAHANGEAELAGVFESGLLAFRGSGDQRLHGSVWRTTTAIRGLIEGNDEAWADATRACLAQVEEKFGGAGGAGPSPRAAAISTVAAAADASAEPYHRLLCSTSCKRSAGEAAPTR